MSTRANVPPSETSSQIFKRHRGKQKIWWITECFVREFVSYSSDSAVRIQIFCKACGYLTYASTQNAAQLVKHVLHSSNTAKSIQERLPSEIGHYADHYRKLESSATIYGVPETPPKPLRKRSNSTVHNRQNKIQKSE